MAAEKRNNSYFIYAPKNALIFSAILHLSVCVFLILGKWVELSQWSLFHPKKSLREESYQTFVQVDVVALPDEINPTNEILDPSLPVGKQTPPLVEKAQTAQEAEKEEMQLEKEMEENKALELKKKAEQEKKRKEVEKQKLLKKKELEKIQKAKALEKLKFEAEREKALKELEAATRSQRAGNILSKGAATQGKLGAEKEQYQSLIYQAIKQQFHVYSWQKQKNLSTRIRVWILTDGKVKNTQIEKSSGDLTYDREVIGAIEKAQPLPVPQDLSILDDSIVIEFRP